MSIRRTWATVTVYAIAMAWVESAVVYYLRTMVDRIQPYQAHPLPLIGGLGIAELFREAATMVMLLTVGMLAGRTWRTRLGYSAVAFGVWDIFYYVFLKVMCDWPQTLFDWDLLFLLPLPWWGPVLAPVSIALLMILWGTLAVGWEVDPAAGAGEWKAWALNFMGMGLALYIFMADAIAATSNGPNAVRNVLPEWFNWPLFAVSLVLMAAPVLHVLWRLREQALRERRPLDYQHWIGHFIRNREHRVEPDWNVAMEVPARARPALIRSLEQFQLGDGGGPAALIAHNADDFRNSTAEMRAIVDLWFSEEKEHSRLLGCAVARLGGKKIESHWSFTAFCRCRRMISVRCELQVLLLTEITSTAYYRLLQRHCGITPLEEMCGLILRDEGGHVSFHRDRLAAAGRSPGGIAGRLWAAQFCLCGVAAATMLWVNHRACLTRLGASTPEFYREVALELRRFLRSLAARNPGGLVPHNMAEQTSTLSALPTQ